MYDRRSKCNDCYISDWTQLGKTGQRLSYTTIKSNENNPNCYDCKLRHCWNYFHDCNTIDIRTKSHICECVTQIALIKASDLVVYLKQLLLCVKEMTCS